ncbi:hypothetical protein OSB04_015992 [Centaurea solstitialis]|uniref:Transposase n=1 Tax=Centaurea solstitialis TaxID=347529 RepID=A0AA38W815_9ASTR|nr:hypothetical protein OSB04_015992 [Centaurea solstitialis]
MASNEPSIDVDDNKDEHEEPIEPTNETAEEEKTSRRSEVWDHFKYDPDNPKVQCPYCKKKLACNPKKMKHLTNVCRTSPLYKKSLPQKQSTLSFKPTIKGGSESGSLATHSFSQENCRLALGRMYIKDNKPFSVVDDEGLREFAWELNPLFKFPSRWTVARDCLSIYKKEAKRLKDLLKGQTVSLTTDTWSSVQNFNYMCLTAHWVDDDWILRKKILNFCPIANHRGDTIGKLVYSCIQKWGIEKVFTVTVDNASSNDGAIRYLKTMLRGPNDVLDCKYLHLRCCACWDFVRSSYQTDTRKTVTSNLTGLGLLPGLLEIDPPVNDQTEFPLAGSNPGTLHEQTVREEHDQSKTKPDLKPFTLGAHIINLVVRDGLEEQCGSISRIRNAVRYVRSSPARYSSFKKCVDNLQIKCNRKPCLDVETRWNSTFFMLETSVKYEDAFDRLFDIDSNYISYFQDEAEDDSGGSTRKRKRSGATNGAPTSQDWEKARNFVEYLRIFCEVTTKISGSKYVTSNLFFSELVKMQATITRMCHSIDAEKQKMAKSMKLKYDKYWDNIENMNFLLYVAVALDPRNKLRYVTFCVEMIYGKGTEKTKQILDKMKKTLEDLFEHYQKKAKMRKEKRSGGSTSSNGMPSALGLRLVRGTGQDRTGQNSQSHVWRSMGQNKNSLSHVWCDMGQDKNWDKSWPPSPPVATIGHLHLFFHYNNLFHHLYNSQRLPTTTIYHLYNCLSLSQPPPPPLVTTTQHPPVLHNHRPPPPPSLVLPSATTSTSTITINIILSSPVLGIPNKKQTFVLSSPVPSSPVLLSCPVLYCPVQSRPVQSCLHTKHYLGDTRIDLEREFDIYDDEEEDCKSELEVYLADGKEKEMRGLIFLGWWKANSTKFPILSQLARHVLAMPISTVASESAFSTGGRVIDKCRSSLNPKTAEALICTQDWIRSSPVDLELLDMSIASIEELNEKLENIELGNVLFHFL